MTNFHLTKDDDTFDGTNGDDVFGGPAGGTDQLKGFGGRDHFHIDSGQAGTINGGGGTDSVRADGIDLGTVNFSNVEILNLGLGGITATAAQLSSFQKIFTDTGGADASIGFTGLGGSIDFGLLWYGAETLHIDAYGGGDGVGFNFVGTANGDIIAGSDFTDTIYGRNGDDILDTRSGVGDLLSGEKGDDQLTSYATDVTLDGGRGNDVLFCYSDGLLLGGEGRDRLTAQLGAPTFDGGRGADYMHAGLGSGTFRYASVADSSEFVRDRIRDFDSTNDTFDLWFTVTGVDATVAASDPHDLETALDAAHLAASHAVLVTVGEATLLVVDANATAGYQADADLVVRLNGVTAIDTDNFT